MPIPASPIDLTTVDIAKYQLDNFSSQNQADNDLLQIYITAGSQYIIDRTGVKTAPTVADANVIASPLNASCHFVEVYDGNGSNRLFLDNWPVTQINQLQIGNQVPTASSSIAQAGYYIERDQKSIAFRSGYGSGVGAYSTSVGWGGGNPLIFPYATGNIQADYNAGFAVVPYDLENALNIMVAQNYKRRQTVDQASKSISAASGGSAVIRFRDWVVPPEVQMVINNHTRLAVKT